jgi:tyrosyl-tRNA synthetase
MDQRKAHMLAREMGGKHGWKKVVAIHTPLLPSLAGTERMDPVEAKMSKSKPDSAVFIHDSPTDIARKLKGAFCPARQVENNPVLELCRLVIFPAGRLKISRPEKYGGDLDIGSFEELTELYSAEKLHPADLKTGVAQALADMLAPVRRYFEEHPDNFEAVKKFGATR